LLVRSWKKSAEQSVSEKEVLAVQKKKLLLLFRSWEKSAEQSVSEQEVLAVHPFLLE
jgi:hypothetical protein